MSPTGEAGSARRRAIELFERSFGGKPDFVVRAPGRVNLIGEHIDYNGLDVLPLALQRALFVALARRPDPTLRVVNEQPGFGERSFELSASIPPSATGDWANYLKAACQEIAARSDPSRPLRGLDAALASDLPVASGLSSSSALVIAVALALEAVNDVRSDPLDLAVRMARAERYTGTQGGGMDQAIVLCGRAGHACRVGFDPLHVTPVTFPDDLALVIASSLEGAEKSGAAQAEYNRRAGDCSAALSRLAEVVRVAEPTWRGLLASASPGELLAAAETALEDRLFRRARHVITEAGRVDEAETALREGAGRGVEGSRRAGAARRLGDVLAASHASLRDDYDVSTAALDELVELTQGAGALGARLTGAGFGGSIVALCTARGAGEVVDHLDRAFYRPRRVRAEDHVFRVVPSGGASVGPP